MQGQASASLTTSYGGRHHLGSMRVLNYNPAPKKFKFLNPAEWPEAHEVECLFISGKHVNHVEFFPKTQ